MLCSALYCWHGYTGEKHALALGVACQLNQQVFTCGVYVSHVRRLDWLCRMDCKLRLLRRNAGLSRDLCYLSDSGDPIPLNFPGIKIFPKREFAERADHVV